MSSMLTRRLAPSDSSREAKLLQRVCHPNFGFVIPTSLIAGVTFLCQSVPGQSSLEMFVRLLLRLRFG